MVVEIVDDEARARELRDAQGEHERFLDEIWRFECDEKQAARRRRIRALLVAGS